MAAPRPAPLLLPPPPLLLLLPALLLSAPGQGERGPGVGSEDRAPGRHLGNSGHALGPGRACVRARGAARPAWEVTARPSPTRGLQAGARGDPR